MKSYFLTIADISQICATSMSTLLLFDRFFVDYLFAHLNQTESHVVCTAVLNIWITFQHDSKISFNNSGFYVKTGQIISTRVDIFPVEYTSKLASTLDGLDPLPASVIKGKKTSSQSPYSCFEISMCKNRNKSMSNYLIIFVLYTSE